MSKQFTKMQEPGNNLLVLDALNLAFRWKHSGAQDFAEEYLKVVESLKKSYKCSKVIIACDKGSSEYRKRIYPEYKQNRKDKYEQQTEAEQLAFEQFFTDFEASLLLLETATDYPILRFQGVEADDIAAYIVSKKNSLNFDEIWLISSDKDWDLLVQDGVSRFSYVTRKEVTNDNWNDHYDFPQEDYISIKCLMGDSGDNVIGVDGIGPKRAIQLVQEYGSAYDIVANLPIQSKYKYVQALNTSGDKIMLNYQLMDLVTHSEEAIGQDNCAYIDKVIREYLG